jgi:hypothetical protein
MLRIETPSAYTLIPFRLTSPPPSTTPVRSTPRIVRSCLAAETTMPPRYVPRSTRIESPGSARAIA